jgi:hypothetical protein
MAVILENQTAKRKIANRKSRDEMPLTIWIAILAWEVLSTLLISRAIFTSVIGKNTVLGQVGDMENVLILAYR